MTLRKFKINNICKKNIHIFLKKDKKNDINVLARIIVKDNNYYISSSMIDQQINKKLQEIDGLQANSLWIVVKSLKVNAENRIFKLSHGDYIKLGRIRFRIKEFSNKFDSSLPSNIINNKSSQVISHNSYKFLIFLKIFNIKNY